MVTLIVNKKIRFLRDPNSQMQFYVMRRFSKKTFCIFFSGQQNIQMPPRPSSSHSQVPNQVTTNSSNSSSLGNQQQPPLETSLGSPGRPPSASNTLQSQSVVPPSTGSLPLPPNSNMAAQGSYQAPPPPHMHGYKPGPQGMPPYPTSQQYSPQPNYSPRGPYPGQYGPPGQPPPPNSMSPSKSVLC